MFFFHSLFAAVQQNQHSQWRITKILQVNKKHAGSKAQSNLPFSLPAANWTEQHE